MGIRFCQDIPVAIFIEGMFQWIPMRRQLGCCHVGSSSFLPGARARTLARYFPFSATTSPSSAERHYTFHYGILVTLFRLVSKTPPATSTILFPLFLSPFSLRCIRVRDEMIIDNPILSRSRLINLHYDDKSRV